jgi:hypothetical protein
MKLNVIWCQPQSYLWEEEWIRWLFSDFELKETYAPNLDCFEDGALYILSSNYHPIASCLPRFARELKSVKGKGLFHLSDEWYSGGYELYSEFDFVIRNHNSQIFQNPGIKILPLGLTNGAANSDGIVPASQRSNVWSFAGTRTAARNKMFDQFKHIEPNKALWYDMRRQERPPLDRSQFKALLSSSIFSPCPMGNVILETFRLYESLEMGCIPIIEQRSRMPYYDRLLPGHPIPSFTSWKDARIYVNEHKNDPDRLDHLQQTVFTWWRNHKIELRHDLMRFVTLGLGGTYSQALAQDWHYRTDIRHHIWRLAELVRHGNTASLLERVRLMAGKVGAGLRAQ